MPEKFEPKFGPEDRKIEQGPELQLVKSIEKHYQQFAKSLGEKEK